MSNNCLFNTAGHPDRDVFKMSERQRSCKSKQCVTKALIIHLKKTPQRHLTSLQDTGKITYEAVFKIFKRQFFHKSNQCLTKPLFTQLIHISGICLGRNLGLILPTFVPFFNGFLLKFCQFSGSRFLFTHKIQFLHDNSLVFDG